MGLLERILGRRRRTGDSESGATEIKRDERSTTLRSNDGKSTSALPRSVPRFSVGDRIADIYEVKQIIGKSSMGIVYLAHHEYWNLDVMVKVPREEILNDPEHEHRITREAKTWIDLGLHFHIAHCYHVLPLEGVPFLVIEYLDGGNLRQWIEEGRCTDLKVGLDLAIQICHGLEHVHSNGLIHRDINPENILLTRDGTLKITGFGTMAARETRETTSNTATPGDTGDGAGPTTAVGIGTPDYMAPEQWKDVHSVDARTDIFAFGVCLYEMLCGRRPYPATAVLRQEPPEPNELRGEDRLPERLCSLLKKCVDWDQINRPPTVKEIREELCAIYEERFGQPSVFAELPAMLLKADGLNNRAVSYLALGSQQEQDAIKAWQEALKEDPLHLEATFNYGYWQWQKGQILGDVFLRQLLALEGSHEADPDYWLCLAWLHLERGDIEAVEGIQLDRGKIDDEEFQQALADPKRPVGQCQGIFLNPDGVTSVSFSPDGQYLLSATDNAVGLWEIAGRQEVSCFRDWLIKPASVSFSPDGQYVILGNMMDNTFDAALLLEIPSGRKVQRFHGMHSVKSVSFSPDGQYFVSGSEDNMVRLWKVGSSHEVHCLEGHEEGVTSVSFSPDGQYFVSGSKDNTVRLWTVNKRRAVRCFQGHTGWVESVGFSPDGRYVVSGGQDETVRLWEVESGREVRQIKGFTSPVKSVSFSPDGRYVVSGSGNTVSLWEVESGQEVRCFTGHTQVVNSVSFSPDGCYVLSGSADWSMRLWEIRFPDNRWRSLLPYPRLSQVKTLVQTQLEQDKAWEMMQQSRELMAKGSYGEAYRALREVQTIKGYERAREVLDLAAQSGQDGLGRRIRLKGAWLLSTLTGHKDAVTTVSFSPDGRYVVSGSRDGTVRLWEVSRGQEVRCFEAHNGGGEAVSFSPDGKQVLSEGLDNTMRVWSRESGEQECSFEGHTKRVTCVRFASDGQHILSGSSWDGTVRLWEIVSGREVSCFRGFQRFTGHILSINFSPDGQDVVSGGADNVVRLWEIASGQEVRSFAGHKGCVNAVNFSPNGKYIVSGGADNITSGSRDSTVRLWDIESGQEVRCFEGHTDNVWSVHFFSDGQYVLSGSRDHTVRLWDIESGQEVRCFEGHTGLVASVNASNDGRYAASTSVDQTVRIWEFDWEWEFGE